VNERATLVERIDRLLPQTQCTRCGYPACRPYAQAIAEGSAGINRCPPGGASTIAALAQLTCRPELPLDPGCGEGGPLVAARIIESACIGCTLCIAACPVDAIIGAPKRMHAVLPSLCTGCALCVPPCPVDCIVLEPVPDRAWTASDAAAARRRFHLRNARIAQHERIAQRLPAERTPSSASDAGIASRVAAALARARARRGAVS